MPSTRLVRTRLSSPFVRPAPSSDGAFLASNDEALAQREFVFEEYRVTFTLSKTAYEFLERVAKREGRSLAGLVHEDMSRMLMLRGLAPSPSSDDGIA